MTRPTADNYLHALDFIIAALHVQHRRMEEHARRAADWPPDDATTRSIAVDMHFWIFTVDRLGQLLKRAGNSLNLPAVKALWNDFSSDFPHIPSLRDWVAHPPELRSNVRRATSDVDGVWILGPRDAWQKVVDVEQDFEVADQYAFKLRKILAALIVSES